MKSILDWHDADVVNIFDEVNLWSAPFGRLLLENIPMKPKSTIVDIGFGTGFPLIELSQRFGDTSKIYGVEIWKGGINRAEEKINTLELGNVEIIEGCATKMSFGDSEVDLVTSNLGINNFEQKEDVYLEVKRILRKGGRLSLTTNTNGTFRELFEIFFSIFSEMKLNEQQKRLNEYIQRRSNENDLISELEELDFKLIQRKSDATNFRFADAKSILNHSLVRIGFREYWEKIIGEEHRDMFFERLLESITDVVDSKGEFVITVPMLYLEFAKR